MILMLRQTHEDNHDEGAEYVRSLVKQLLWAVGVRNAMRSIKSIYVRCRKLATHFFHLYMDNFLDERVEGNVYSFKNTGVDYFGPFEFKLLRRPVKNWI